MHISSFYLIIILTLINIYNIANFNWLTVDIISEINAFVLLSSVQCGLYGITGIININRIHF